MSTVRNILGTAFLAVALLAVPSTGAASHYYVTDIADRFTPTILDEFQRFGLLTTEDVLRNVDTPEDRSALGDATGIPADVLLEITRMCDFLQIEGIGPRAYDLLRASGVRSVADLASRDSASLHAEIVTVNAVERLTGVDPDEDLVANWIAAAGSVPINVVYQAP
jgi:hypothetical protein